MSWEKAPSPTPLEEHENKVDQCRQLSILSWLFLLCPVMLFQLVPHWQLPGYVGIIFDFKYYLCTFYRYSIDNLVFVFVFLIDYQLLLWY